MLIMEPDVNITQLEGTSSVLFIFWLSVLPTWRPRLLPRWERH